MTERIISEIIRTNKWPIIFLLGILILYIFTSFYWNQVNAENYHAWGYNEDEGYFKIHVIITNNLTKYDGCLKEWKGCAITWGYADKYPQHAVILIEGTEWEKTNSGYNRYTHEMLHHWGYPEQSISQLFPSGDLSFKYGAGK